MELDFAWHICLVPPPCRLEVATGNLFLQTKFELLTMNKTAERTVIYVQWSSTDLHPENSKRYIIIINLY